MMLESRNDSSLIFLGKHTIKEFEKDFDMGV